MTPFNQGQSTATKIVARAFLGLTWRMFTLTQCHAYPGGMVKGLISILANEPKEIAR